MALERDKHTAQHALLTLHESQLLDLYRRMTLIRRFEEALPASSIHGAEAGSGLSLSGNASVMSGLSRGPAGGSMLGPSGIVS